LFKNNNSSHDARSGNKREVCGKERKNLKPVHAFKYLIRECNAKRRQRTKLFTCRVIFKAIFMGGGRMQGSKAKGNSSIEIKRNLTSEDMHKTRGVKCKLK
jgi:hypothetical protein